MKNKNNTLTPKQEKACVKYVETSNMSEAYRHAYNCQNMQYNTVNAKASTFFAQDKIKERVAELIKERTDRLKINADYVLKRLIDIDNLDVSDIVDENGDIKPVKEWPKAWRTSISAFDVQAIKSGKIKSVLKRIKMPDKLKNLELIGKHTNIRAWQPEKEDTAEALPLNINMVIKDSKGDVAVTIGESDD